MSELSISPNKNLSKSSLKLPERRPDNIEYSEHFLRRVVQRNLVRSGSKNMPANVYNDYLEHKKNLPLYLHRVTAELKRHKGNDKSLKELFSETPDQKPVIVFPNMSSKPNISRHVSENLYKLPDDPINRKVLEKIAEAEPIDYFVIETPAAVEKKKPAVKLDQKPSPSPADRVRSIISKKVEADMAEKIEKCYKDYSKVRTVEKLRRFGTEELKVINPQDKSRFVTQPEGESIYSYNNPQARRLFTTQGDYSQEDEATKQSPIKSKETEENEQEEAIMGICKGQNIKIADFFNMNDEEFFRKYQKVDTKTKDKSEKFDATWNNLRGSRFSTSQENIRTFDATEILLSEDFARPLQKHIKKMFRYDEISKKREKEFLFDKFTIGRGLRLNSSLQPEKNSKRRQQVIMQTKFRKNLNWRNPHEQISIEKVTISTGDDPKLIRNTEKLALLLPKTAKKLQASMQPQKWMTSTPSIREKTEEEATRITFEDDDQQIIQKMLKGHTDRFSFLDTSTHDGIKSTISGLRPKTSALRIPPNMDFVKIKRNKQEVKEMHSLFTDFYDDLVTLTTDNQKESNDLHHELAQVSTMVGAQYDKIHDVHNKAIVTTLAKDFTNLQKKNKFKHRLIQSVMNKVYDKRGLVEEYERRIKDDTLQKTLLRRNLSMGEY